jgi:hypothetical protein
MRRALVVITCALLLGVGVAGAAIAAAPAEAPPAPGGGTSGNDAQRRIDAFFDW